MEKITFSVQLQTLTTYKVKPFGWNIAGKILGPLWGGKGSCVHQLARLNRGATPARVMLGVTTVLTMTTLISSTNASLPKISYVKSIDAYLAFCFFMVFASLIGECHLCSGCLLVSSSAAAWISKAAVVASVQWRPIPLICISYVCQPLLPAIQTLLSSPQQNDSLAYLCYLVKTPRFARKKRWKCQRQTLLVMLSNL